MKLRPGLALTALTIAALALSACGADSPLADGPGPLPDRAGPLTNNQGNQDFAAEDYNAALDAYALADQKMPERPEPEYNSGNALYRMESLEEAQGQYQGALVMADDDEISRNSLFNIGNVLFLSEQYPEAIEAYKETLRIDPTDLDAKHNLELALQQLQQQQQPQPGESEDEEGDEQQPEGEPEQQPDEEGEQENQEQQQGQGNPSDPPQQSESEEDSDQEPQPAPIEGLTEEQALQLLQSVGENTDTLQSRIQQVLVVSGPGPESNW
jgi:tetratricopeptide (TPR) repeat protein